MQVTGLVCSAPWQAGAFALGPLLLLLPLLLPLPWPPQEIPDDSAVVADAERHPHGRLFPAITARAICRLLPAELPQLDDSGSTARCADHIGMPPHRMRRNLLAQGPVWRGAYIAQ